MGEIGSTICGPRVALRSPTAQDHNYLLELARSDPSFLWTLSLSHAVDLSDLGAFLREQLDNRIIELRVGQSPIGYVAADYRSPPAAATVRIGTFVQADYQSTSVGIEAAAIFISYLFEARQVRRIEGIMLDDGLARIQSGLGRYFTLDATFREAAFVLGNFTDVHILSISREEWHERGSGFTAWLLRQGGF